MASPLFRGVQAQLVRAVLHWLDLEGDEILVCEREEDLDRLLTSDAGLSVVAEQVKDLTGRVSARDHCVREAIANFAIAFRHYDEQRARCMFVFTTTARLADQRLDPSVTVDVLNLWLGFHQSPSEPRVVALSDAIKALEVKYRTGSSSSETSRRAEVAGAHAYLDRGHWQRFLSAVQWNFDASTYDEVRECVIQRIECEARFGSAPSALLFARLMGEVLERSAQSLLQDRAVSASDLTSLAALTRSELETWVVDHELAGRLASLESEIAGLRAVVERLTEEGPDPFFVEDEFGRTPAYPDIYVLQLHENPHSGYPDHRSYEHLRAWIYSPSLQLASIEPSEESELVGRIREAFIEDGAAEVDDRRGNSVSIGHRGDDLCFHRRWSRWAFGTVAMASTIREWRSDRPADGYSLADVATDVTRFLLLCASLLPPRAEVCLRLGLDPGKLRPLLDPGNESARQHTMLRGVSGITRPVVERSNELFFTGSLSREILELEACKLTAEFIAGCTRSFHGALVDTSELALSIPELIAANQSAHSL